ncbi:hypothetical protein, partial [Pseudoalteromonas fuliginea]|uniref:hypothetical protein n=1 Tax=Pseudoalteromonas fuliginea TaxID=1872678 RepID=UPI0005183AE7
SDLKLLQLFILFLILTSCGRENKEGVTEIKSSEINSLVNNKEIEQFIGDSDSLYKKFTLKKIQDIECTGCDTSLVNLANKLHVDYSYIKAD